MATTKKPAQGTRRTQPTTSTPAVKAKRTAAAKPINADGSPALSGPGPAPAPTFDASATNGYHQCRICLLALPVIKFPTVAGPEHRSTRCRTCRDNVSPTVQAKRAAKVAVQEAEAMLKTVAASQAKKGRKT